MRAVTTLGVLACRKNCLGESETILTGRGDPAETPRGDRVCRKVMTEVGGQGGQV